jgi:hypothetical protein
MDEDVAGTRKTVIGTRYDTCTRCGRPIPLGKAVSPRQAGEGPAVVPAAPAGVHPAGATRDAPPPRLCPECDRDVAAGEPLEEPDEPDEPAPPDLPTV